MLILFIVFGISKHLFDLQEAKRNLTSSINTFVCKLPHELPNHLILKILGNQDLLAKPQNGVGSQPSIQCLHKSNYHSLLVLSNLTCFFYFSEIVLTGLCVCQKSKIAKRQNYLTSKKQTKNGFWLIKAFFIKVINLCIKLLDLSVVLKLQLYLYELLIFHASTPIPLVLQTHILSFLLHIILYRVNVKVTQNSLQVFMFQFE